MADGMKEPPQAIRDPGLNECLAKCAPEFPQLSVQKDERDCL